MNKLCPKCSTLKPMADFPRSSTRKSGISSYCLGCESERQRAAYAATRARPRGPRRSEPFVKLTAAEWAIRKTATKDRQQQRRNELFQGRNRKITGERFGLLLVLQYDGQDKWLNSKWICLCQCGRLHTATKHNLTSGVTRSCGCRGIIPFVCTKCGVKKEESDFCKDNRKQSGRGTICKHCTQQQTKRWVNQNRDRLRFLSRKRYASRPDIREQDAARSKAAKFLRKTRLQNVRCDLTAAQWRTIKSIYKNRCAYCGEKKPLTQDHIIPVSKGGAHTASNIIPACRSCNSSKGARLPLVTYQPHLIA